MGQFGNRNSYNSLKQQLSDYRYLDDLEYNVEERLRLNARRKYKQIMHSIRPTKDEYDSADSESDLESDSKQSFFGIDNDDNVYFYQILKRHKRRLRDKFKNSTTGHCPLHHHHHLNYH